MTFTETNRKTAAKIARVFETSRADGDYSALAVLDDKAGISYGINQFTHRSGSLAVVVERYLANGGRLGADVLREHLPKLKDLSGVAIYRASTNAKLKQALKAAAETTEMKTAQESVAYDLYMKPAIAICSRYGFVEPLSLAVVYDSVVHGSFFRIARSVAVGYANEREWVTAYVRRRDAWFASYPRLRKTRYRTRFFLEQIAKSNWQLRLPINVQGVLIRDAPRARELSTETASTIDNAKKRWRLLSSVTTVSSRSQAAR